MAEGTVDQQTRSLTLPHSAEAERAVLGAILGQTGIFAQLVDRVRLKEEHFFLDIHRKLFRAIGLMDSKGVLPDLVTLGELLHRSTGQPPDACIDFLGDLQSRAPLAQNIEHYGLTIRNKFYVRRVILACQGAVHRAMSTDEEAVTFVEEVEREFLKITQEHDRGDGLLPISTVVTKTLEVLETRIALDGACSGVSSGFADLDRFTGGWQKSDLIILAARPGMGKTALALNWAMNALKSKDETRVAIFTLEMSREQLAERLLASEGRVDSSRLRKGDLSEEDQDRLMHAARRLHELHHRLVIDETPGISLTELRSRIRRYKKEHGLNLVLIDYLQLMSSSAQAQKQSREREIGEISMGLKALAKELAVPVIALAQLNRSPDARPDKRPKMSDLRESGSMEQDADQILFVFRDEYYNPHSEHAGKAEVLVAKNRHGETGSIYLAWFPNFVTFHSLAPR